LTREGELVLIQAETICIHGDTPGAEHIAEAVRKTLEGAGVEVKAIQ